MPPPDANDNAGPVLLDRILRERCARTAIVGLHAGAGTRTVLKQLVHELARREQPVAVSSSPRVSVELGDDPATAMTRIPLPAGAFLVTSSGAAGGATAEVDLVEQTPWETPMGRLAVYRVGREGEIDLHGPAEADKMDEVLGRLEGLSGANVLVEGTWERRGFAAPGITDGIVLAFGAGYSATPERSIGAARFAVEMLSVPVCRATERAAWEEVASHGRVATLDGSGRRLSELPARIDDPVLALRGVGESVATLVLPHRLSDDLLVPLVKAGSILSVVVRDPTRIRVSPVYFQAWLKAGCGLRVVHPARIVAVAANPWNRHGADSDAAEFYDRAAEAFAGVPVHDAVRESEGPVKKAGWRFW